MNINYYGFDRESYYECMDLIKSTNRKHIFILNTWFSGINALYLVFAFFNLFGVTIERVWFYALFMVLSLALDIILAFFPKFGEKYSRLFVYLSMILMSVYGIMFSVMRPYMPATMFLILISMVSLSYTDKMFRMISMTVIAFGAFIATSFMYKTFSIAYNDTYNAVIVMILAVSLHYMFQRTRIQQFVLYQKDLQVQRELEVKSSFDSLTSLFARGRFFSIAEEVMRSYNGEYIALCLLDLDGFKEINDRLGHQMGDKAIQVAGKTILEVFEIDESEKWSFPERVLKAKGNFAGRLGGDEFIAVIRNCSKKEEVEALLNKLLSELNKVQFDSLSGIHSSIGVTAFSAEDIDIDHAYKRADDALYESKRAGKNQIHFYEEMTKGERNE